ncbi:MAG: hypothetical protein VXZ05_07780 [Pseudomonadota bacterium]|nr:hypothetical protein [Pseudomonadota bacterium]
MFELRVADNYDGVDEDNIYTHGRYKTWDEAVQAAKDLVDCSLADHITPGMTAKGLFQQYQTFGDDPFIVPVEGDDWPDDDMFSAKVYARERCEVLTKLVRNDC